MQITVKEIKDLLKVRSKDEAKEQKEIKALMDQFDSEEIERMIEQKEHNIEQGVPN